MQLSRDPLLARPPLNLTYKPDAKMICKTRAPTWRRPTIDTVARISNPRVSIPRPCIYYNYNANLGLSRVSVPQSRPSESSWPIHSDKILMIVSFNSAPLIRGQVT